MARLLQENYSCGLAARPAADSMRQFAPVRANRAMSVTFCDCQEGSMTPPLLQACLATAVILALYAFYCFWEAGRADFAASFRHPVPGLQRSHRHDFGGASYRARARWAGLGAVLLVLACLASLL
jgi:hypothetical protein